jgi:hypothetical protein
VLDILQKVFYRSNPAREAFVEVRARAAALARGARRAGWRALRGVACVLLLQCFECCEWFVACLCLEGRSHAPQSCTRSVC